ncbi:MAG: SAM-dependent methyltransferase [Clostridia bacterium]|nr:SAM-dependent methyltransferase [Clostridia bacterium]
MKNVEKLMSNRLRMISDAVRKCSYVHDIGTDHAYVPIDLIQKRICDKAFACDVKKGPLLIADKNIEKYKLQGMIVTRLGDGLAAVLEEPDCIIIAGMGGILISQLINNHIDIAKRAGQLVVQAMNHEEIVRESLLNQGFSIEFEKLIGEGHKIYNMMSYKYAGKENDYFAYEYYTSRYLVEEKDMLLKPYLKGKLKRLHDIAKGQHLTDSVDEKLLSIKEKMEEIYHES